MDDKSVDPDWTEAFEIEVLDDDDDSRSEKSDADESESKCKVDDLKFVNLVEKCGKVLLAKSQTPAMRAKKSNALAEMSKQMILQFGSPMSEAQVKKKLNNMKTRAKTRADLKKTGNKPIILSKAEKKLLELLDSSENPSISNLKCMWR